MKSKEFFKMLFAASILLTDTFKKNVDFRTDFRKKSLPGPKCNVGGTKTRTANLSAEIGSASQTTAD